MTALERNSIIKLIAFAVVSITAGLYYMLGLPDWAYFFFRQLSEVILLYAVYCVFAHHSYYRAKIITGGLIFLSIGEAVDETLGNNFSFHINDYVLLLIIIIVAYKLIKKNGRHST